MTGCCCTVLGHLPMFEQIIQEAIGVRVVLQWKTPEARSGEATLRRWSQSHFDLQPEHRRSSARSRSSRQLRCDHRANRGLHETPFGLFQSDTKEIFTERKARKRASKFGPCLLNLLHTILFALLSLLQKFIFLYRPTLPAPVDTHFSQVATFASGAPPS